MKVIITKIKIHIGLSSFLDFFKKIFRYLLIKVVIKKQINSNKLI